MLIDLSVKDFVYETASSSPAPGGGAVSALAAAQGAALFEMVANLTINSKKYEDYHIEMKEIAKKCKIYEDEFLKSVDEDANSFNLVMEAFKMPKESEEDKIKRSAKIQEGYKKAAIVPFEVGKKAVELFDIAQVLVKKGNTNAITDIAVGVLNTKLAISGAFYNVEINLLSIKDKEFVEDLKIKMDEILDDIETKADEILREVENKIA